MMAYLIPSIEPALGSMDNLISSCICIPFLPFFESAHRWAICPQSISSNGLNEIEHVRQIAALRQTRCPRHAAATFAAAP